jgi:cell wall-associated NlpC family hydrolase
MPDLDARRAGAGRARRRAGLVVAITVAAFAAPSGALADTLADRQAEADQVQAELAQMDHELELAIEAYNAASQKLEDTEARVAENTRRLEITRSNLHVAQEELNDTLVNAYMHGDTDFMQVVLGADSISAVLDEVSLLTRATRHSADVLTRVKAYKAEVAQRQGDLEREETARRQAVADRQSRRAAVEHGLAARQSRLSNLNAEIRQIIAERAAAEQRAAEERARQAQAALQTATANAANTPSPAIGGSAGSVEGGGATGGDSSGGGGDSGGGGAVSVPAPPPASGLGASAAGAAMSQLGTPYVWAGAAPGGFDCSGLVMWAFAQVGISLPHNAAAQYGHGTPVDKSQLAPGDLVFFSGLGHVGIYIGGGQYVHAPQTGDVVKVSSVNRSGWVGARRVA